MQECVPKPCSIHEGPDIRAPGTKQTSFEAFIEVPNEDLTPSTQGPRDLCPCSSFRLFGGLDPCISEDPVVPIVSIPVPFWG